MLTSGSEAPDVLPEIQLVTQTTNANVDLPAKLAEILEAIGAQTVYTVTVQKLHEQSGRWQQVGTLRKLPEPDDVGRMFGGGEYCLHVSWRTQGNTKGRPNTREVSFYLGDSYDKLARESASKKSDSDPGADLDRVLGLAERIAKINAHPGSNVDGQAVAFAGMIDRVFDRLDRMQEKNDSRFEKLAEGLLEIRRAPVVSPLEGLRELMTLGKELGIPMIGQKDEPETRPAWLEVVDIVAENAGKFLDMMTAAQKSNVAKIKLMANPQARRVVQVGGEAMKDPIKRAAMIEALDKQIGKEKTDQILAGLGQKR